MTLAATVRAAAARFGDRHAFVDPDGSHLTYQELDRRSDEIAAGLVAEGIEPGDVVVLSLPSDSHYVAAYAAIAKARGITAGVNPRLTAPEQAAIGKVADGVLTISSVDQLEDLRRKGAAVETPVEDPDRPVALVFTSGTTGAPKGALFLERQLAAITQVDGAEAWGDSNEPAVPMLAATQFAHVGFMTKLPWYLRQGTTTHVLGRWRATDVLATVAEHRLPTIGGVAPQIALLLREDLDRYDLSCVRALIVGGAASPPNLVREARQRFDAGYSIRYSSTESGGCGTGTAFDADDDEALHSVGRPRGGIEVAIGDEHGPQSVGPADVGEVWLRSPTAMAGYWRDPDATAATLRDGWLRTGDLGRLDERGLLRLAGRSKDMYIRGGYNVYPAEVEAALGNHPDVAEVAVVARPDDVMGEIGVAVIVPVEGATAPTLDDLRSFLAPTLARHKQPEALRVVTQLPLTAMHKIDRQGLEAIERAPRRHGG